MAYVLYRKDDPYKHPICCDAVGGRWVLTFSHKQDAKEALRPGQLYRRVSGRKAWRHMRAWDFDVRITIGRLFRGFQEGYKGRLEEWPEWALESK